ncbi:MAG: EAL domain-containing protein [Actinomycetota bacterium]|nr:EAL domain-containing protein [Actinomycetota bacterium]
MNVVSRLSQRVRDFLPQGRMLSEDLWRRRHHGLVWLLWAHAIGLVLFSLLRGNSALHSLSEGVPVAVAAALAGWDRLGRRLRSGVAAVGLVTASAILVHLSGGVIETHFHYFVIIGLLSLYQEWLPFLLAIGYVVVQHGVIGWLAPESVYNHAAAINSPWRWAGIHGTFVLAASVANLLAWRLNEHQALHDALTGLPNRTLLVDRIRHAASSGDAGAATLIFLDLDDFKTVNDSFGHPVGDELLVAVSERLRSCVRAGDTTARLGGDEFVVLLQGLARPGDSMSTAERLIDALRTPFVVHGRQISVSASLGVALSSDQTEQPEELLHHADMAMYAAKRRRKGGYEMFEPAMHEAVLERIELESALRGALARGEFVLHYQPIVALDSGRMRGMEALVRWQHPQRGLVLPGQFITLAEETGLIVDLGAWVLAEACRQAAAAAAAPGGRAITVSVNLSPRQLQHPGLVALVADTLSLSGLPAERLMLEVTEGCLLDESGGNLTRLHELRRLGVRLAVDDFGTGYSSLSYLRRLPIDVVKLDRAFVEALHLSPRDEAMVDAIVRLCGALGLDLVAEGVESAAQARALHRLGVAHGQGYHLARPTDVRQALSLLGPQRPMAPV